MSFLLYFYLDKGKITCYTPYMRRVVTHCGYNGGTNGICKTYCGVKGGGRGGEIRQTTCKNCIRVLKALIQKLEEILCK